MKTQYLIPVVAILLVVSVSGCVGFDGFKSWFGPTQATVEQTPDILITTNQRTIPNPPILADSEFTVMFTLKNQDQTQSLRNVGVKLYDWGVCNPVTESGVPQFLPDSDDWYIGDGFFLRTFDEFFNLEEKVIEFNLMAPDNQRIGNIETDCPVKWEVNYTFSSRSQDDFTAISKERKREFDVSGTSWTGTNQAQYVGIGPVKMYFDFKTPMPVQSESSIQFGITVVDKGSGIYPKIEKNTMFIKVPKEWVENVDDATTACTTGFQLVGKIDASSTAPAGYTPVSGGTGSITALAVYAHVEDGYVVYTNDKDISLYNRESSEIICRFKAPDLDTAGVPEKSYFISANITDYDYRLLGSQTIHIKPSV